MAMSLLRLSCRDVYPYNYSGGHVEKPCAISLFRLNNYAGETKNPLQLNFHSPFKPEYAMYVKYKEGYY